MSSHSPVTVAITGAAGQICYSLIFNICKGDMFGAGVPVVLHLLDIEPMMGTLGGVVMEIEDCAFPLVAGVRATHDPRVAFANADVVVMAGAMPRKEGMQRADLLRANAGIFEAQGRALNEVAKKTVKVLVVGNPANTNCLLAMRSAPTIPQENFTALTRLDQNRAYFQIANKVGVSSSAVKNIIIWGNHSNTQYPDATHGTVTVNGADVSVAQAVNDQAWLEDAFIKTVQVRGAAVIAARKLSSAASAANAIVDHVRDWWHGTAAGRFVSMGVVSDGSYGIPEGVIYSYPVTISPGGAWRIVQDLPISDFARTMMTKTANELVEERDAAIGFLSKM